MIALTLVRKNVTATTASKWTQKQSIRNFQSNFKVPFDMDDDYMDLRAMSKNYPQGIIPLEDIHQGILAIKGPQHAPLAATYDPSGGIEINYPEGHTGPKFGYFEWDQFWLWSIFQRDVSGDHVIQIKQDFRHNCVLTPCAIKITIDGKPYLCVWDGHHTLQVLKMMGYSKFPVLYVDIDNIPWSEITAAGFPETTQGRIDYGCWLAGTSMISINSKNKYKLTNYDEFMIKYDTKDGEAVELYNIITKHKFVPKRRSKADKSFTQFKVAEALYQQEYNGVKGLFLDRALDFHNKTWPAAASELEVFRPMAQLYQKAALQGKPLDAQFDQELTTLLRNKFGDPESVQEKIKLSYDTAILNNTGRGQLLKDHAEQVMNGIINAYNQNVGRAVLPAPSYVWTV